MHAATTDLQYNQKVQVQAKKMPKLYLIRNGHIEDTSCKD